MKKILALKGIANVGKTTSIRAFYQWFKKEYHTEELIPNSTRNSKEVFTIFKFDNIIIGIGSAGDNKEAVEWQFEEFRKYGCDLIIGACRTRGGPYEKVMEYEKYGYEIEFIDVKEKSDQTKNILAHRVIEILNQSIQKWLKDLETANVLVKNVRNEKEFYHLNTPSKIFSQKHIIEELKAGYNPDEEKGGFILYQPVYIDGTTHLNAKQIVWIENMADDKRNSYRVNTPLHNSLEYSALNAGLLPLAFHTHPAPEGEGDFLFKSFKIQKRLNTSDADKEISYQFYWAGNINLLLPDILVVGQTNYNEMLFVGVYNGLITPIDFENQQKELTNDMVTDIGKSILEAADTEFKKGALIVAGIASIIGLFVAPRVAVPLLLGAGAALPVTAMSFQKENKYFGITGIKDFIIMIPRVTPEIIQENERMLQEILSKKQVSGK